MKAFGRLAWLFTVLRAAADVGLGRTEKVGRLWSRGVGAREVHRLPRVSIVHELNYAE
jgi:hypothetical protein